MYPRCVPFFFIQQDFSIKHEQACQNLNTMCMSSFETLSSFIDIKRGSSYSVTQVLKLDFLTES